MRKFLDLRIDIDEIYAYETSISSKREAGWHDTLYFFVKGSRKESLYVNYDTVKENREFKEAIKLLDDYFSVKSDAEDKILP